MRKRLENAKLRLDFAQNYLSEINSDLTLDGAVKADARHAAVRGIGIANAEYAEAFEIVLKLAADATGADMGTIQVLDGSDGVLKIRASHGFKQPFLEFFARVHGDRGSCCGAALTAGRRVIVNEVMKSAIFAGTESLAILVDAGVQAVQSTPMVSKAGELVGMFSTHYRKPTLPTHRDLEIIDELAAEATTHIAVIRPAALVTQAN